MPAQAAQITQEKGPCYGLEGSAGLPWAGGMKALSCPAGWECSQAPIQGRDLGLPQEPQGSEGLGVPQEGTG